ncbi:MAG: hypothetical protein QOF89_1838 [Acidobacteriota bacterium]|jgi:hypothetical protein|nr:hypothetical protein [Acidobacteriota bacterium]
MAPTEEISSIHNLLAEHDGEWLALDVVERDSEGLPQKARLLASANSRLDVIARIKDQKSVYIKFAGPLIPTQYGFLYPL